MLPIRFCICFIYFSFYRIESLDAALKAREKELEEERSKFVKLKEDFKYNLRLLNDRHNELEKYDSVLAGNILLLYGHFPFAKNDDLICSNGLITLAYSGTGTGDRKKNGLYEIVQNVSHYTGTGTPLFPIVLIPVLVLGPVPE